MIDISINDLLLVIGRQTVEIEALRTRIAQLEAQLKGIQKNDSENSQEIKAKEK